MFLEELELGETKIRDISPLAGMKLRSLDLWGAAEISDISVLKGMPLQKLLLGSTKVKDLSPLKGMKLNHCILEGSLVEDISALTGMPLEFLDLSFTKVRNLEPLKGMPLRELFLSDCEELTDLTPLLECNQLKSLVVSENLKYLGFLKKLPQLKFLGTKYPEQGTNQQKAADFWKNYQGN